jgi:hypothetical protein
MATYRPTAGRSGADVNFENAVRAREARTNAGLLNPGFAPVAVAPGWDAFYGGLDRSRQDAADAGMGFSANLGGIGRFDAPAVDHGVGGGGMGLADAGNPDALRQIALKQFADAQRDDAIKQMQASYDQHVLDSVGAPRERVSATTESTDANGKKTYTIQNAEPDTRTDRERLVQDAPGSMRPALDAALSPLDLAERKQALAERTERAAEASNPLLSTSNIIGRSLQLTDASGAPLQGQAVLDKLAPAVRNQVQSILDGRQSMPTGTATKDPYWKAIIQIANQVDPSFDAVNYNARANTRKDFTSGKSAGQINAINTAIGHLSDLAATGEKLGNTGMDWVNKIYNYLTPGGTDRGVAINNFNTLKEGVGTELMRVWRQAGAGSEKEIQDWKSTIDAAKSPEELRGAFGTIGGMLESKLSSLDNQYQQGMGTDKISIISPEARARLDKLQGATTAKPTTAAQPKVGDVVNVGGKRIKISAIHPDGSFDGDPEK